MASDTCSIPNLEGPLASHTLSILSRGRLVICGGRYPDVSTSRSCIYWAAGKTTWTILDGYTTRCVPFKPFNHLSKKLVC